MADKGEFRLSDPVQFLALGFGSGLAKKAPGTFGTLVAIPLFLLMSYLPLAVYLAITAVLFVAGIAICGVAARSAGVHDHPAIVWDEIVGYLITMIAVPIGWQSVLLGFLLFRFFDILKPWPIGLLDRYVAGGLGIMIDDVVAGLFALGVLQLGLHWVSFG